LLERAVALLRPIRPDVDLELDLALLQPTVEERVAMARAVGERARAAGDRRGELVAGVVAADQHGLASPESTGNAEALVRQALPLLEEAGDDAGLVHVWVALAQAANNPCRFEDEAHAAEQAIYHARRIGRPGLFRLAHALMLGPRPADEALATLTPLLADDPHPSPRLFVAILLAMLGRVDEARELAQEQSRRLRELTGDDGGEMVLAFVAEVTGDHESAARDRRAACDRLERQGNRSVLSTIAPELGRSLCLLGRFDEAEPLAQLGRDLGDSGDAATQMQWRQAQALVCSHRGQHEEAERLAREAVAIAAGTDALTWQGDALCDLAEVLERAGRAGDAKATLEQALERYERKRNLAMVAQVRKRLEAGDHSVPLA
jgi:tetratricopeptide (TPR) repeat protein